MAPIRQELTFRAEEDQRVCFPLGDQRIDTSSFTGTAYPNLQIELARILHLASPTSWNCTGVPPGFKIELIWNCPKLNESRE